MRLLAFFFGSLLLMLCGRTAFAACDNNCRLRSVFANGGGACWVFRFFDCDYCTNPDSGCIINGNNVWPSDPGTPPNTCRITADIQQKLVGNLTCNRLCFNQPTPLPPGGPQPWTSEAVAFNGPPNIVWVDTGKVYRCDPPVVTSGGSTAD